MFAITELKKNSLEMVEALANTLPNIVPEADISAIKDKWKTYMAEKDSTCF